MADLDQQPHDKRHSRATAEGMIIVFLPCFDDTT